MGRKDRNHTEGGGGSLGDLLKARGLAASAPDAPSPGAEPEPPADGPDLSGKVVVRRTRKGRGGRTVTLVQGAGGDLDALAATLRKRLGTGARVEADEVAVQGDVVDRVVAVLETLGAARIVRG